MNRNIFYFGLVVATLMAGCFFYKSVPASSIKQAQYVVIGCSAAGYSAAIKLAQGDSHARVVCLSEENVPPYDKTAIHAFVKGKRANIDLQAEGRDHAVDIKLGKKVVELDRKKHQLKLSDNSIMNYDKLLIATGARPNLAEHLKNTLSSTKVLTYNSRASIDAMIERFSAKPTAAILIAGAGIRSLELADGLKARFPKLDITIINRSARIFGESGDDKADKIITHLLQRNGVQFLAPAVIRAINDHGDNVTALLDSGREISADLIVFNEGTRPNSELAKAAGLALYEDGSIVVDDELRTNDPHIFAAGDVAGFKNPIGDGVVRSKKWRAAKSQGKIAAKNMLGQHVSYRHEPTAFTSSFFGKKVLMSGMVRLALPEHSRVSGDDARYSHLIVKDSRLKGFIFVWDRSQKRPNIFALRRALFEQSPLRETAF